MSDNNRDRRDDRGRGSNAPANRQENDTRWVSAGAGWPLNKGEGFNIDVDWPIKQGSRLQLLPPKDDNGQNRPWQLYELREKPKRDNNQR
jgi:hypothetical protein